MLAWRILASAVLLILAGSGWGQTYSLVENPQPGDHFQYRLAMTLAGEMKITKDRQPVSLKLKARALHEFPERILAVGHNGVPQKTARYYETAKAVISVGGDPSERTLRPERSLIVHQHYQDQTLVYCPKGSLTREELELTSEHFDTLALTGLLPGKAVAIGDTWTVANDVAQSLSNFEGLTSQGLTCKLINVERNTASVSISGSATGIDLGALVKQTIDGRYEFDLKERHLISIDWKQKDDRDQGPANPATVSETTISVKRKPIAPVKSLTDVALISVPDGFEVPAPLTQLYYRDPKSRFEMVYGRGWQTTGETEAHLVMRLMERGDLIAQVTITPWTKANGGDHMAPDAFQKEMAGTPGWEQGDVLQTGVVPSDAGYWIYRVSALGAMDGIKLMQNFYLVAGPQGDQLVVTFTMTQAQAEKLAARDLALVGSIDFPGSRGSK